jgi:Dynein heavy chain, N-terminal region 2
MTTTITHDKQVTMTQAMQFSAFKGPFADRIDAWNAKLYTVSEVVEAWLAVQRNWLYLQPIFDSPDINKQVHTHACYTLAVNSVLEQQCNAIGRYSRGQKQACCVLTACVMR